MERESKASLRRRMRETRARLASESCEAAGAQILERLLAREDFRGSRNTGLYWALPGEVPTQALIQELSQAGGNVFLPRLQGEGLEFAEFSRESDLVVGRYGIREPGPSARTVRVSDLDLIIVPGLAFDGQGHRLGQGWGCYDRTLKGYRGRCWALAFDFQVLEEVPADDRDEGVDWIFTERRSIQCL